MKDAFLFGAYLFIGLGALTNLPANLFVLIFGTKDPDIANRINRALLMSISITLIGIAIKVATL